MLKRAVPDKALFAIAFVGRQGASYLQAMLDSHPDAVCQGELFAPSAGRPGYLRDTDTAFEQTSHKNIELYLSQHVQPKGTRASGFKLPLVALQHYPHLLETARAERYRIIQLSRENLVDQYISLKLATINGAWRSDAGSYRVRRFRIEPAEMTTQLLRWTEQNLKLAQAIDGIPSIHLTYEDLLTGSGILQAMAFLGLPAASLTSRFQRQRQGRQRDIIENFDQVKYAFRGTAWERHFD
ncbi:hypothetical protein [Devosia sp.]|uniref:hypothetical protein n=1 Tax=Devosia sp. TaxID=1871048 RepID=UPI003A8E1180